MLAHENFGNPYGVMLRRGKLIFQIIASGDILLYLKELGL